MAHWAEIDKNGIVLRVLYHENKVVDTIQKEIAEKFNYEYTEPQDDEGYQWIIDNLDGTWIKTSYNGSIRKNFASVGYKYDKKLDAFIPPQNYSGWILNKDTCKWEAPVAYPEDGKSYFWNENTENWEEVPIIVE